MRHRTLHNQVVAFLRRQLFQHFDHALGAFGKDVLARAIGRFLQFGSEALQLALLALSSVFRFVLLLLGQLIAAGLQLLLNSLQIGLQLLRLLLFRLEGQLQIGIGLLHLGGGKHGLLHIHDRDFDLRGSGLSQRQQGRTDQHRPEAHP